MDGEAAGEGWGDDDDDLLIVKNLPQETAGEEKRKDKEEPGGEGIRRGRAGRWEGGEGRCAVTGRRILGGTEGLRRVMV